MVARCSVRSTAQAALVEGLGRLMVALAAERYGELLDLDAIRTALAAKSLRHFVREAWHVVEPGRELVPGFYIDAICDHLQAVMAGEIKRLVITLPPGFLKSTIVCVLFPAWIWINQPEFRFLTTSHDSDLAMRDAVRSRRVMTSDWYQERWGDRFAMTTDQNVKTRYENDRAGHRISLGTGSGITGKRGDLIICDDPHDAADVYSASALQATVRWWNEEVPSRLNDPKNGAKIIIQQRLHVNDLAGVVIEQGYEHLNLPMEYEPTTQVTSIGWTDPRSEPGELLDPVRYGPEEIAEKRRELGSRAYNAQYQQEPQSDEGGIVKRHWWRFWQHEGMDLPPVLATDDKGHAVAHPVVTIPALHERAALSWDMTFDKTDNGSYVVGLAGQTWGPNVYITDRYRARVGFTESIDAILAMRAAHPHIITTLIEKKANGAAAINTLSAKITGLMPVNPDGSKEARLNATLPLIEAGNVLLPHPQIAPWVQEFIDEHAAFPNGANDDQVDADSQLVRYLMPPGLDDGLGVLRAHYDAAYGRRW